MNPTTTLSKGGRLAGLAQKPSLSLFSLSLSLMHAREGHMHLGKYSHIIRGEKVISCSKVVQDLVVQSF